MNITINIDDTTFNNSDVGASIVEAFKSLSKDELIEIMKNVIIQYLNQESVIRGYFIERAHGYGYNGSIGECPTAEFKQLISKIDLSNITDEIKNKMENMIKHDLEKIVVTLITESIISGLAESVTKSSNLYDVIRASTESYLRWKDGNK